MRADELEVSHAAGSNQLGVRQQTGSKNGNGYGGEQVNIQQINNLKKIMNNIDGDYQLNQMLYERHVELIDAIKFHQLQKPFYELERKGVRCEILEELMMSSEFEECLAAYQRELTGIIAKWDLADQLDTARNAA